GARTGAPSDQQTAAFTQRAAQEGQRRWPQRPDPARRTPVRAGSQQRNSRSTRRQPATQFMNTSLSRKLDQLMERHEELERLLSDAEVIADQERFRNWSREYAELEPVVHCNRELQATRRQIEEG